MTRLDLYSAAALNTLAPLPQELCPTHPIPRSSFEWVREQLGDDLPRSLIEHRDRIYASHLALPFVL